GEQNFEETVVEHDILFAQRFGPAAHVLEPTAKRATFSLSQILEKNTTQSPEGQVMLIRQSGEFDAVPHGAHEVTAHQFEPGRQRFLVCVITDMRNARTPLP